MAWTGLLGLLLGIVLVWVLTSELALHWAVRRAVEASNGRLSIEQVSRIGIAGARAERIAYTDGDLAIEARNVVVIVSAASLLHLQPVARQISADTVRIELGAEDKEVPQLPETIALPMPVAIRNVQIRKLLLVRAGEGLAFGRIEFALSYAGDAYRLDLKHIATPWAMVDGELRLQASTPFALRGTASVEPQRREIGRVDLALAGRLDAIGMGVAGTAFGARVSAQAAVLPFASRQLARLEAQVRSLQTREVNSALPQARLDIGLEATFDRGGAAAGRMHANNAEPGRPADSRLPINVASAAFHGSGTLWGFDDIDIDAGAAGRLTGHARLDARRIVADLQAQRLDLHAIHAKLNSTRLGGPLHVESDGERVKFAAALEQSGARIAFDGDYHANMLSVRRARWRSAAGELQIAGSVQVRAPYDFRANGSLAGVDPARLGDFPPARLNGTFEGKGRLAPMSVELRVALADSSYRGQVLAGAGRGRLTPERVSDVDLELRLGNARAQARGSLGAPEDRLAWNVDIPDLRLLQARAAGRLKGEGMVRGRWREPAFEFRIEANGMRWGERVSAGRLAAKGSLAEGMTGRFEVAASADAIVVGEVALDSGRIDISGTRARHDASIESVAGAYRLQGHVTGGLSTGPTWSGSVRDFQVQGPIATRLEQPVDLTVSAAATSIGAARLQIGTGRIDLSHLAWQASGRLAARGSLSGISLAALRPVVPIPEPLRALIVAGEWDVDIGESIDGRVSLRHAGGDIVVPGSPPLAAGLRSLTLELQGRGAEIALHAELDSAAFGHARAVGVTRASRRGASWGLAGNAPLELEVSAQMPSLAWARPLLGDRALVAGRADLELQARGTIGQPEYGGQLRATDLEAGIPDLGLTLRNGRLDARFDGQQIEITALRFASGDGVLAGTGSANLAPGRVAAHIDLKANKLTALSRPDRLIVVSGQASLAWDSKQLRAQGKLTADRGLIELPRQDTPRPSSDVVVLTATPQPGQDLKLEGDFDLDLGNDFSIRGRGVSTRLTGTVHAQLNPKGKPTLTGTVRAVDGTYNAFGQTLSIERGTLSFVGPVDNPALDILAVRKNLTVEVGVAIGGTALLPQVRLVSTPPMSDADKLAWLTLGHGLDQAGRNEAAVLQAAALALLSRGGSDSGLKGGLASRFGLDELSLGTVSATGERVVTLGKRLASNVYLGFERGITGAVSVIKITYDLSRRWSVQARAGTENAVDLFYTLGFR